MVGFVTGTGGSGKTGFAAEGEEATVDVAAAGLGADEEAAPTELVAGTVAAEVLVTTAVVPLVEEPATALLLFFLWDDLWTTGVPSGAVVATGFAVLDGGGCTTVTSPSAWPRVPHPTTRRPIAAIDRKFRAVIATVFRALEWLGS
jgi:hypothetical protein